MYLSEESETRQGLATMNEHLAMFSSARVMASNVTYEEAAQLYQQITQVEGVTMVDFSNTEECYKDGAVVYITGNVLLLENGKAFKIGNTMQPQMQAYENSLPLIGTLYEVLEITAEKTDSQSTYSVTVPGEQVGRLLEAASLGEVLPVEGIQELQLQLTEKNGNLDHRMHHLFWEEHPGTIGVERADAS